MRLGIDAREIQEGVYTGIGRPLANFLEYFASIDNNDHCVLFSAKKIPLDFAKKVSNVVIPQSFTWVWDQWHLPRALQKQEIDLFYSPYYKIPLMKPCKSISTIYDLMYLAFEPYARELSGFAKAYYFTFGKAFCSSADKILTSSEFSKRNIQRLYGVGSGKIEVIALSLGSMYHPDQGPSPMKGRYILYMGNFKPHKNVASIIKAFRLIADMFPDLTLVLAGPKEHTYPALVKLVQENYLSSRVVFLGRIDPKDNPKAWYSHAQAFVMPSLYEGFGLPPLEAMACGAPVISSNTTSIPEVVRQAGLLVDPLDVQALADAIKQVLQNAPLRQEMIDRGLKLSQEYQSSKLCAQLYEFFKAQLNEKRS